MGEEVCALDIGTRKIAGVVLEREEEKWRIKASSVLEHQTRPMVDGQIQDIPQVAKEVNVVKEKLEKSLGKNLPPIGAAAAGRALKTSRSSSFLDFAKLKEIQEEDILSLKYLALKEARKNLTEDDLDYTLIGYTVSFFKIDGQEILNPLLQKGRFLEVEVIATFLPRIVIDSLYTVVQKTGLELGYLTLEPIAASQVVIPESMRKLNIALVDIGAGTSDIAVSRDGSFIGYDMVDFAGDEITEEISRHLLVDFTTAETIKKELRSKEEIEFTDVLGIPVKKSVTEIAEILKPQVDELAAKIAEKIILINGTSPQAVFLIGGGSLTYGLEKALAEKLGITHQRVGLRDYNVLENVEGRIEGLNAAQAVTPVGIALISSSSNAGVFKYLTVNGKALPVFELQKLTVFDALVAAGFDLEEILGKPGRGITVEINGEIRTIAGTKGTPARIKLNKKEVDLETPVEAGDEIVVEGGQRGEPPKVTLREIVLPVAPKKIFLEEKEVILNPSLRINNQQGSWDRLLQDKDVIFFNPLRTLKDILKALNLPLSLVVKMDEKDINLDDEVAEGSYLRFLKEKEEKKILHFKVNGEETMLEIAKKECILADVLANIKIPRYVRGKSLILTVNGKKANFTTPIKEGDEVVVSWE